MRASSAAISSVADVPGVADDEREPPFKHGIDGLPGEAGALHPDMGHAQAQQPLAQRVQITCHRPEGAHLLGRALSRFPDEDAGHPRLLVNVQPGHSLDHHPHARLHDQNGRSWRRRYVQDTARVLPGPRGNKEWYLCAARAGLLIGVAKPPQICQPRHDHRREVRPNRPATPPFSPIMARHRRRLAA